MSNQEQPVVRRRINFDLSGCGCAALIALAIVCYTAYKIVELVYK